VTGQGDKGLETEGSGQGTHLINDGRLDLGRVTASLQQGQHQGSEFVPHGDAGEMNPRRFSRTTDGERGPARILAVVTDTDLRG
jgi:hypothetical protein